jgi:hypothetical protein
MTSFLYRVIAICIITILVRNLLVFLDKTYADKDMLPPHEMRYYHTDHSALCADGIRKYGYCSKKTDK